MTAEGRVHEPKSEPENEPEITREALRARALAAYQKNLAQLPVEDVQLSPQEVLQTIHELRVHQIELEMQNDELRQSQAALSESQGRFRDLFEHAPVGYCLVNSCGLIQDTNCTMADMLGLPACQIARKPFHSFIDNADQDVYYHLKRRLISTSKTQSCELRIKSPAQNSTWVQLSVSIATVDGDSNGLRVALVSVDERVRAENAKGLLENQLREAQKMEALGTLASGVAHDFNNILTVILVNAEVACRLTKQSIPHVGTFVEEIQKAAGRARDLVNQILAFCRNQPTDRQAISLSDVIAQCIDLLRSTMPARFELKFTCDSNVPKVLADRTQIEQVIINLANNAMQAMNGSPGRLRIHLDTIASGSANTTLNGNWPREKWYHFDRVVRISVSDDGPGMAPDVKARIFEPFFTTKPVNEGTGLGLSVVHGIVRSHDGEIVAESQVGLGTTFTIYLPPAQNSEIDGSERAAQEVIPASSAEFEGTANARGRIVYVDDDEWVLNSVVRLLSHHGVSIRGFAGPMAALNALRDSANQFDVLISDYNMPGLSGLEFAKQVQKVRPSLPVVIASGYIDNELRASAKDAGVMALLPKPFSVKCILELIERIMPGSQDTLSSKTGTPIQQVDSSDSGLRH